MAKKNGKGGRKPASEGTVLPPWEASMLAAVEAKSGSDEAYGRALTVEAANMRGATIPERTIMYFLLKRLAGKGYVTVKKGETNGRRLYSVTAAGAKALGNARVAIGAK